MNKEKEITLKLCTQVNKKSLRNKAMRIGIDKTNYFLGENLIKNFHLGC